MPNGVAPYGQAPDVRPQPFGPGVFPPTRVDTIATPVLTPDVLRPGAPVGARPDGAVGVDGLGVPKEVLGRRPGRRAKTDAVVLVIQGVLVVRRPRRPTVPARPPHVPSRLAAPVLQVAVLAPPVVLALGAASRPPPARPGPHAKEEVAVVAGLGHVDARPGGLAVRPREETRGGGATRLPVGLLVTPPGGGAVDPPVDATRPAPMARVALEGRLPTPARQVLAVLVGRARVLVGATPRLVRETVLTDSRGLP